jgi:hypothetical protein
MVLERVVSPSETVKDEKGGGIPLRRIRAQSTQGLGFREEQTRRNPDLASLGVSFIENEI